MGKDKVSIYREVLRALPDWDEYLKRESRLPGPRGNLELAQAVAEEGDKVIFLHKIVPGGTDRSYGIHVAQLAGLPKSVIVRAQEVLAELESHASKKRKAPRHKAQQLALFPRDSLLADEIAKLDVDSMSPLEAITKLYELRRMVGEK